MQGPIFLRRAMARAKEHTNVKLDETMSNLAQAQALLVPTQAQFLSQLAEHQRAHDALRRENAERFARIETVLIELTRMMDRLPEAVREKIGFKMPATE